MQKTRTLIVDDNASFRQNVKDFLVSEPAIEVIGEAADGQEALRKARELKPDLVLMDVRLPGMSGIQTTRQLKDAMPALKVIILTLFDLQAYREAATASGASDYIVKKSLLKELVPAMRRVMQADCPR